MVEQRRKAFQEIGTSGAKLDSASGISINKIDSGKQSSNRGKSGNSNKSYGNSGHGNSDHSGNSKNNDGSSDGNYGNYGRGNGDHGNSKNNDGSSDGNYGNKGRGNYGNRDRGSYGNRGRGSNSYGSNYGNYGRGNGAQDNYGSNYGRSNGAYDNYGSNYGNKKNNGECYECGKFGHYQWKCPNKASAKAVEMDMDTNEQVLSFNSVQMKATQVHAFYPTIPKILTKLNVGEAGREVFECDSAASHNVLKRAVYEKLRNRHPRGIPELVQEKQQIQLADGTISKRVIGSVSIKVQASNSEVTRLDFFVMDSPNNLLGRLALEKLWPQQYND